VFLVYHSETKRAVLPNEVTSIDTVRALFVRSFPHILSMRWFDAPSRKIYILDQTSGIFYELDDLRFAIDLCAVRVDRVLGQLVLMYPVLANEVSFLVSV